MGNQKQFEAELQRLHTTIIEGKSEDRTKLVNEIMEEIRQSIFKTDEHGNYLFNRKGWPKVDWLGMIFAMGKIAAKFYVLNMVRGRSTKKVEVSGHVGNLDPRRK